MTVERIIYIYSLKSLIITKTLLYSINGFNGHFSLGCELKICLILRRRMNGNKVNGK